MKPFRSTNQLHVSLIIRYIAFNELYQWNKHEAYIPYFLSDYSASPPASFTLRRCLSPSKYSLENSVELSFSLIIYYHILCAMSIVFFKLTHYFNIIRRIQQITKSQIMQSDYYILLVFPLDFFVILVYNVICKEKACEVNEYVGNE